MAKQEKKPKKMNKRTVLIAVIAVVLVVAVGVGAFFLFRPKEEKVPAEQPPDPQSPELVRHEVAAADHIGVIHVEQEAVADGASKVLITLTDVDSNVLDTYETAIRDGEDIGDVKIVMPESEKVMGGCVLLTGSEMEPLLVTFFRGVLYPATILEWVEEEGSYDENAQPVGTWTDVTLPNGDVMKLPRGASEEWLLANLTSAGQIADQMLGEGNWRLREVPLPADWVEFWKPVMVAQRFKSYNAFEICTASGDVKATVVLDSMRVIIDIRLAGSTEWQDVAIQQGPVFVVGGTKL